MYGSLRWAGWNAHFLVDAVFVGEAKTVERFSLFVDSISGLPYLTTDCVSRVVGEVYAVPDAALAEIDVLEGHPESYCRCPVIVELADGSMVDGEAYFWQHSTEDLELVSSGDWLETCDDPA